MLAPESTRRAQDEYWTEFDRFSPVFDDIHPSGFRWQPENEWNIEFFALTRRRCERLNCAFFIIQNTLHAEGKRLRTCSCGRSYMGDFFLFFSMWEAFFDSICCGDDVPLAVSICRFWLLCVHANVYIHGGDRCNGQSINDNIENCMIGEKI